MALAITHRYANGDVRVAHIGRVTRQQYDQAVAQIDAINARAERTWQAVASLNALSYAATLACPDCGHTADRTTPCLCPGRRDRGQVADTLPL